MNRKQYLTISWFFLILMFLLMVFLSWFQYFSGWPLMATSKVVMASDIYFQVRNAIFDVMIYLSFPLFVLFQILGWLEKTKRKT